MHQETLFPALFRSPAAAQVVDQLAMPTEDKIQKLYTFHHDAGHGWLCVPCGDVADVQMKGKISGYSYMRSGKAYLEEDCDAPAFLAACMTALEDSSFVRLVEVPTGD
jgi:hypothetical protein